MHTLYAFPFSCSLAVRWVLTDQEIPHRIEWVTRGEARQIGSPGFPTVNPSRKVPVLVSPEGAARTEIVSVLWHLDPDPTRELLEALSFLSSDVHQAVLGPLFDPASPHATRADVVDRLLPVAVAGLERRIDGGIHVLDRPSTADRYALWALLLIRQTDRSHLSGSALSNFFGHHVRQPSVAAVLQDETTRFTALE